MPCSRLHTWAVKIKDLILHVITSLSVSRTHLPIHHPLWEALIWEMVYYWRQQASQISLKFSDLCVALSNVFFCISVCICLLQEHIRLLSCRPWELRTGTAESPLQTFPRSECRPPAAALTCLSTVQILCCSDRLAVHHPDERLWSPLFVSRAVTGEILQISKGRWITESNMT